MTRHFIRAAAGAAAIGMALPLSAAAQTPFQPQPGDPQMPARRNTVPEKMEGGPGDTTGTLSDKLEKSDGVITPPAVGGGRTIIPPDPGTTPVIPPPSGGEAK